MNSIVLGKAKFVVFLLFLFSLDALDLSGVLISLTLLVFFVFYAKDIVLDKNMVLLVLFSVFYSVSVFYYEGISFEAVIKYSFAPWGCYLIGYHLSRVDKSLTVTKITTILFLGFFLHGALNLLSSIQVYGIDFSNPFRYAFDFWQNRQISVTTAALYYSPMALLCTACLFTQEKRWIKLACLCCIAISLFATVQYQNRTLLVALLFVTVCSAFAAVFGRQIERKKKLRTVAVIAALALMVLSAWISDFLGVRTLLEGSRLYARMTGEGQDRTKIWASFLLGEAWKYPFGGNQAILYHNKPFVHNFWLDVFRRAGIIPFFLLILFTIRASIQLIKYSKVSFADRAENQKMIALGMLGLAVLFCVEPVIEANPYVFYIALIIIGAVFGKTCDDSACAITY